MFSCLLEFLSDNDMDINMIKEIITAHPISLQTLMHGLMISQKKV
jgi:hypothetical protein